MDAAIAKIIAAGNKAIKLPVSAPFHCSLMDGVKVIITDALNQLKVTSPKVPLVSNVLADIINNPEDIKKCLIEQISGMVRWRESMISLKKIDVLNITEVGAGKVLTGITKRIDSCFKLVNVQTINDIA